MMKLTLSLLFLSLFTASQAQETIPFDTARWDIYAQTYILENYRGADAIYLHHGRIYLRDTQFKNGTVEFDVYLTERHSFPGVYFHTVDGGNEESFYLRPHLSGKEDANHALPAINGIVGWQLYFGPTYSFAHEYKFDDWTHVKLVVNGNKAQVYLDHAEKPQLSWYLKHEAAGEVGIGGSGAAQHYANFTIDHDSYELVDFDAPQPEPVEGVIPKWSISDKFIEYRLDTLENLYKIINERKWTHQLEIEENSAVNISRAVARYGTLGNTVFAKVTIEADEDCVRELELGFSDRARVILNGKPIYKGNNRWRSRDYRYLGTIGLFDAAYLHLKKGKNTLLIAVSEDFGGWGVMGRIENMEGIKITP